MNWFKKNKDWLITLAVFGLLGIIGLAWSLFFRHDPAENHIEIVKESVRFTMPSDQQNSSQSTKKTTEKKLSSTFFLEPGPTEILEKLENLNYQEFRKESASLPGLKVMWPAYFFSIREINNGIAEVLLDVSEDGFGALILTDIDTTKYPEILKLQPGKKIWLAGEITGVDPSGTGQFIISTEHVKFDDYQPHSTTKGDKEKQKGTE